MKTEVMKRVLFISLVMFMGFGAHQALRVQAQATPDEKQSAQPRKRGGSEKTLPGSMRRSSAGISAWNECGAGFSLRRASARCIFDTLAFAD